MSLYSDSNPEPTWADAFRKFWPGTDDERGARQALKLACFAYNARIALLLLFGFLDQSVGFWPLVDILLLALFSFGVYKASIIAATVGVVYLAFSCAIEFYLGPPSVVFMFISLLIFIGTLNGIRGSLAIRRLARGNQPE